MDQLLLNYFKNSLYGIAVYERVEKDRYRFVLYNTTGRKMDGVPDIDYEGKFIEDLFPNVHEFGIFEKLEEVFKTGIPQEHQLKTYKISDDHYLYRTNKIQKLSNGYMVCQYHDESKVFDLTDRLVQDYETFENIFNYSEYKVKGDFSIVHQLIQVLLKKQPSDELKKINTHIKNIEDKIDALSSSISRGMKKIKQEVFR